MPLIRNEQFANLTPIAGGSLATQDIPRAGTYYGLTPKCLDGGVPLTAAQIVADVDDVKLTLNGQTICEATPGFLHKLHQYYHASRDAGNVDGIIPIPLARDHMPIFAEAAAYAVGMIGVNSFQLELDLASSLTLLDEVELRVQRSNEAREVKQHLRVHRFPQSFSTTGEQEITNIPREANTGILALHVEFDGSGTSPTTLDQAEIIVNGSTVAKYEPEELQHVLEKAGRDYMVTGSATDVFSIPFDLTNDLTGYLPMKDVSDLRLKLTWGGAAPSGFTVYRESVFGLGN